MTGMRVFLRRPANSVKRHLYQAVCYLLPDIFVSHLLQPLRHCIFLRPFPFDGFGGYVSRSFVFVAKTVFSTTSALQRPRLQLG